MRLRFTNHAQYRLFIERGISAEIIKKVLNEPDGVKHLPDGVMKCGKNMASGELVVVFRKTRGVYIIITAYFKE